MARLSGKAGFWSVIYLFPQVILSVPLKTRDIPLAAGCDGMTKNLAVGIMNNIATQYQGLSVATQLLGTLSADSVSSNDFEYQKGQLVSTIQRGMSINQDNRNLAFMNDQVNQGMNMVADNQNDALNTAQQLGTSPGTNIYQDSALVERVMQYSRANIDMSTKNYQMVVSNCVGNNNMNNFNNFPDNSAACISNPFK